MKNKLLVVVGLLFLVAGYLVGQTSKNLSMYGCTRQDWEQGSYHVKQEVCYVYDAQADKHFIVATLSSAAGVSTAIVEEK